MVAPILVATTLIAVRAVNSQATEARPPVVMPCPNPWHFALTQPPPSTPTPDKTDFGSKYVLPLAPFSQKQNNKWFLDTFAWKTPGPCCQFMSGTLTIKYHALFGGQVGSPTSWNDDFSIWRNGVQVPGSSKRLYPQANPVTTGQTGTLTIPLTAALVAGNRISFAVEDDTAVDSASIDVAYCCLRPPDVTQ